MPFERKLLYNNPDAFSKESQDNLTNIIHKDMNLLATAVVPIYAVEHGCNDYDSWSYYYYWYRINKDKITVFLRFFVAY